MNSAGEAPNYVPQAAISAIDEWNLMPVKRGTGCSYFDGPPIVSCLGFCVKDGKLAEPVDVFDHMVES